MRVYTGSVRVYTGSVRVYTGSVRVYTGSMRVYTGSTVSLQVNTGSHLLPKSSPLWTPSPPPCTAEVQLGPPQVDVDVSSLGSTVQILTIYQ